MDLVESEESSVIPSGVHGEFAICKLFRECNAVVWSIKQCVCE